MSADLEEKTLQYEALLAEAIDVADTPFTATSPLSDAAEECLEMASAYLNDGRHFHEENDTVNALAAFSYGHAWLDAGARIGLLSVPVNGDLFSI